MLLLNRPSQTALQSAEYIDYIEDNEANIEPIGRKFARAVQRHTTRTRPPALEHTHTQNEIHIYRPLIRENATATTLLLAMLSGLPTPDTPYKARNPKHITLLNRPHVLGTLATYKDIVPDSYEFLVQHVKEALKSSFYRPLGKVGVKGVIQVGSKHTPTLALELDSDELQQEMHILADMCNTLNDTELNPYPIPHVSIGKFQSEIPKQVIETVEAVAPSELTVGPVKIQEFKNSLPNY